MFNFFNLMTNIFNKIYEKYSSMITINNLLLAYADDYGHIILHLHLAVINLYCLDLTKTVRKYKHCYFIQAAVSSYTRVLESS